MKQLLLNPRKLSEIFAYICYLCLLADKICSYLTFIQPTSVSNINWLINDDNFNCNVYFTSIAILWKCFSFPV